MVIPEPEARLELIIEKLREENKRLMEALEKAAGLIKQWHNMGSFITRQPENEIEAVWKIYYEKSPEMKPIREALSTNQIKE